MGLQMIIGEQSVMGDQEKLDELIRRKQFDELRAYIRDKEDYVSGLIDIMLCIRDLEKRHDEAGIWDGVDDAVSAMSRYLALARCMERLLSGKEVPDHIVTYLRDCVSSYAMAAYILLTRDGVDSGGFDAAKSLFRLIAFDREYHILSSSGTTVVERNLRQEINGYIEKKEFCVARELIALYGGGILKSVDEAYVVKQAEAICDVAEQRLYAPTMLSHIGGFYFVVDCLHNRVLYSPEVNRSLPQWRILDSGLRHPHSVSGDGDILLAENTEHNTVCIYKKAGEEYKKVNETECLGERPCRIIRDGEKELYWVLCSGDGNVAGVSVDESGGYRISYKQKLSETDEARYTGFALIQGMLYMISSLGTITTYRWNGAKWDFAGQVSVPEQYSGINDLMYLNGKYYLSTSRKEQQDVFPALIQVDDLGGLQGGKGIDLHEKCQIKGIPYFFSQDGMKVFIPEVGAANRIVSYDHDLQPLETVFDFGETLWEDTVYGNAGMF